MAHTTSELSDVDGLTKKACACDVNSGILYWKSD